mgnify:CR=1 FL=1
MRGVELAADDLIRRDVIQKLMCNFELDFAALGAQYGIPFADYFAPDLAALGPLSAEWRLDPAFPGDVRVTLTLDVKRKGIFSIATPTLAYLEADETRLLIDAGLSARQIRERLLGIGRTPEKLSGILITHEHSDHVQGLGVLAVELADRGERDPAQLGIGRG